MSARLLVITQKVDATDSNLGFFVRWIEELSKRMEITVIANEVHPDALGYLTDNIHIESLGKERGASRSARFFRYQRLLFQMLPASDGVFFHMCPEYVLAAHMLPKLFRVRTVLWYVHKSVSWRLRVASRLVGAIFTASKESCRLTSKKVEVVGHGIDTAIFTSRNESSSKLHLVTVGRISPIKDLRTIILGFRELQKQFPEAELSIVGEPITSSDREYRKELARYASSNIHFKSFPFGEVFISHPYGAFVHASRTGSMDKAVLEALAAGLTVFTSSEAFSEEIPGIHRFAESDPEDLAEKIGRAYTSGDIVYTSKGREWVERNHSLQRLIERITAFYSP